MTTRLEEILAEEWGIVSTKHLRPDARVGERTLYFGRPAIDSTTCMDMNRAVVALLGHRALSLVLKHEWQGDPLTDVSLRCVECGGNQHEWHHGKRVDGGHEPGCAWGDLVREAKEIG